MKQETGGIEFVGILQIVFIVLKLIGKISWKWVWVLSPIWISFCFAVFILGITMLVLLSKK